jgi:hypothetical protein
LTEIEAKTLSYKKAIPENFFGDRFFYYLGAKVKLQALDSKSGLYHRFQSQRFFMPSFFMPERCV